MTIELISKEQFNRIEEIQKKHKILTFQNNGYEYIKKADLTEEDKEAIKEIESILKKHVIGFSHFNNFCHSKKGYLKLRFQYNYGAEDNTRYFEGVGYIELNELLNGFN